ncbi:MAG: hypothetical protein WCX86_08050 [Candidatus Hydrogenedentales bacterium]
MSSPVDLTVFKKAMDEMPKIMNEATAAEQLRPLAASFTLLKNPPYVFPPYEICPLAPASTILEEGMEAAVMDMDGTTTTTEALCIESLATMVSCMCGKGKAGAFSILSPERDYPHIIGNSTTLHVKYLVTTYGGDISAEGLCRHFIRAAAWNISCGIDPLRAEETRTSLITQGLGELSACEDFQQLGHAMAHSDNATIETLLDTLTSRWQPRLVMNTLSDLVRIGIEIYYQHYHELLKQFDKNDADHETSQELIKPMPGIGIALAMMKGLLGEETGKLSDRIRALLPESASTDPTEIQRGLACLLPLGRYFQKHPVKLALVTSSIAAEAKIVLKEVFQVIRREIKEWEVSEALRESLHHTFADPATFYDARITADDSSEIRLKPHRDLYSIALHTLGIPPDRFHRVAGFEDSESGVTAIRTAGISLSCAVPFAMTADHGFDAATVVCTGGMPEVILKKRFFLPEKRFLSPE